MGKKELGKYICTLRKDRGYSQKELGDLLGVTNEKISSLERGRAIPQIDYIARLSEIFNIPIDNFVTAFNGKKEKSISKIVITGGPCAGKTTAMSWIQNAFVKKGYYVIFVPEVATELINAGVTPSNMKSRFAFQLQQMRMQLEKEKIYFDSAKQISKYDKILIIFDRGIMDTKAYINNREFNNLLVECNLNETEARDSYDAVFHLVTAAKGAEEFYTLSNNTARSETVEQAVKIDDKIISAWTGHPHLRVIDNSTGFEDKMKRLIAEISTFLGEPEPCEIERKFLIEYPNINLLKSMQHCKKVEIIQTYLKSDEDEVRIRQRGENGNYIYFKTVKKKIDAVKRIEIESRLTKNEYLSLMMEADTSKRQIRKDRYCLTYDNQYFEIDVYPFWKDKAIMEIELKDENENIVFPDFIKIIKEVTKDEEYKNARLAAIH